MDRLNVSAEGRSGGELLQAPLAGHRFIYWRGWGDLDDVNGVALVWKLCQLLDVCLWLLKMWLLVVLWFKGFTTLFHWLFVDGIDVGLQLYRLGEDFRAN